MFHIHNQVTKGIIFSFCLFISTTLQAQFKVVGYLTNWGNFVNDANNIDYTKVTHVNIAFFNPTTGTIKTTDIAPVTNLSTVTDIIHTNNALAIASFGGANASTSSWSSLMAAATRTAFISKISAFAIQYNLDGIDIDLEGSNINSDYNAFAQELCDTMHAHGKIVTTAIGTWQGSLIADQTLAKYDLINVMSYDYYGTWTGPGQHSPYSGSVSELNYWVNQRSLPKEKVILGVPSYGYIWDGSTKASLTYTQIVDQYPRAVNQDSINTRTGGVIYYNGIETIKEKTVLALANAGGIMMWTLQDDYLTSDTKSLIRAISEVIKSTTNNIAPVANITYPLKDTTLYEGDSLLIMADASDADGKITKVSFYYDATKISESATAPYQATWKNLGPGKYNVYVRAVDDAYANSSSDTIVVTVLPSLVRKPYLGKPWIIPGRIEAENFDLGNNLGYYDTDAANNGGSYRTGPVDIESCIDSLGGYDIGWTAAGEWLKYTIRVTQDTKYQLQLRYASLPGGGQFHIEKNDTNVTQTITLPATGGWQVWKTYTISNLKFTANDTVIKFVFEVGDFNINYFNFRIAPKIVTSVEDELLAGTDHILLYPNPCESQLTLQYELKNNTETSLQILDVLGRTIYQKTKLETNGIQTENINTEGYAKGVYQLLLNGKAQKFIVK